MRRDKRRPSDLLYYPLAWLTDARLADSMLGDLEELRQARSESWPAVASTVWFWRAAIGLILHALRARVRERTHALIASGGGARGLGGDLQHAVRTWRRNPAFAAGAILLLALGIGTNTAVFTVVRAVLLRPLPYVEPDRLVYVWPVRTTDPALHRPLTGLQVQALRDARTVESFAVMKSWVGGLETRMDLVTADRAERLRGTFATPNLFDVLGVKAQLGRTFDASESDGHPVVVISDGLWRRLFAADQHVLGRELSLATGLGNRRTARAFTVIGVLPPAFRLTYPEETEIFAPLPWTSIEPTRAIAYDLIARLREHVSPEQAASEMTVYAQNAVRAYADIPVGVREQQALRNAIVAEPATHHVEHEARRGVLLLAAVAGLVLLIACVNLALLVMARTVDRRQELAVRGALGAGPARIVRQLLAEGAVLSAAGGSLGVGIAFASGAMLRAVLPPMLPRGDEARFDPQVLGFAVAISVLTTIICGLTPVVQAVRTDLQAALRRSSGANTDDRGVARSRRIVVALQVAVVLLLMVGAGLLLQSFWRIQQVDLGFDGREVITLEMRLLNAKYLEPGRTARFQREVIDHVRAVPGVADAALATAAPMRGVDFRTQFTANGVRVPVRRRTVDGAYFDVMRIPVKAGRRFDDRDGPTGALVAMLSEAAARAAFGHENPIGRRIGDEVTFEVVGVVGDVRHASPLSPPEPAIYLPRSQEASQMICVLVRPERPGLDLVPDIRRAIHALDPEQPVEGVSTLDQVVSATTAEQRFYTIATTVSAATALVLAIVGVVGVVSRMVTERQREIAIRVALGADVGRVRRGVLWYGITPVLAGLGCGVAAAVGLSRLLRSFLFEISATDPASYVVAVLLVTAAAALACYLPARRATAMAPMAILKGE